MKILFVCTGNTCRSCMAEALARQLLHRHPGGEERIEVFSAGIAAWPGDGASRGAIEALAAVGVDVTGHTATRLTPETIHQADLVLTMTAAHREYVRQLVPPATDKIFTLAEYTGSTGDIPDPVGQPVDAYRKCAERLKNLIILALDRL